MSQGHPRTGLGMNGCWKTHFRVLCYTVIDKRDMGVDFKAIRPTPLGPSLLPRAIVQRAGAELSKPPHHFPMPPREAVAIPGGAPPIARQGRGKERLPGKGKSSLLPRWRDSPSQGAPGPSHAGQVGRWAAPPRPAPPPHSGSSRLPSIRGLLSSRPQGSLEVSTLSPPPAR